MGNSVCSRKHNKTKIHHLKVSQNNPPTNEENKTPDKNTPNFQPKLPEEKAMNLLEENKHSNKNAENLLISQPKHLEEKTIISHEEKTTLDKNVENLLNSMPKPFEEPFEEESIITPKEEKKTQPKTYEELMIKNKLIPIPNDLLKVYDKDSINILGSGAFGSVFSINRKSDGVGFAIKRQVFKEAEDFHNITKEINLLYRLIPYGNIVYFQESYSDLANNAIFIVMEKGNMTLADLLKENRNGLQSDLLRMLVIDIIFGLSYAYQNSVVHSDIKPANILVFEKISRSKTLNVHQDPNFENLIFKLTDFGAGTLKIAHEETKIRKEMSYTIAYAAPEINMAAEDEEK